MLVLGRNLRQRVFINGGEIIVTVLEIHGDAVRLGFEAGSQVRIYREEVQRDIDRGIPQAKHESAGRREIKDHASDHGRNAHADQICCGK